MKKYLPLLAVVIFGLPMLFALLTEGMASPILFDQAWAGTNTLKVRDAYGMTGGTVTFYVDITNQDSFCGFQFDLVLPSVLTLQTATITLTDRAQDQTLNWNLISTNTYRFIAISFSKSPFNKNSGAVLRFDCSVSGTVGSYTMTVQSAKVLNAANQDILTSATNGLFTIYIQKAKVKIKAWLEGWYDSGLLRTAIRSAGDLPWSSPYPEAPRTATSLPGEMADWILLEMRTTAAGDPIFFQSYLLKNNGYLTDMDGINNDLVVDLPPGSYYLILRHRNHAAVMSSTTVALSWNSAQSFDFTTAASQYYGGAGKMITSGVYAMPCGDLNADKQITTSDYVSWFHKARTSPAAGYHLQDLNGDRLVNDSDFTLWQASARQGMHSAVP